MVNEMEKGSGVGGEMSEGKNPVEGLEAVNEDNAIEWQYAREFFSDKDKHDDRLYERSQRIEDSLQEKLPDDLVRGVDHLIASRLQDLDDQGKAGESEIDRSMARDRESEGTTESDPLYRLEMDLRSEDGGRGMTLDLVVEDLKEMKGEERQERIKAVQVFGTAMRQEVLQGKEWDEASEEEKLLARTAEDFKLQGDLAEAEDILKSDGGNDEEARKLALAMAVEFDSYRENNDIRGKLQHDLEYAAVRLRRFAKGEVETREEKRDNQSVGREPEKTIEEGAVIEDDEDGGREKDIVEADFEVEEWEKAGVDYGYKTERYVSIVEKMPEDADGKETLKARGRVVDQIMTGESELPADIRWQLDKFDFLLNGRDKQAEGSVVKLIPERYFKDRDMQGRVKRIVEELRHGEAPDDVIKGIKNKGDRRDMAALKIVGARIIQERVPKEGEWRGMSEKEKVTLRLGEEIVHQAEMAALEDSLNKGELSQEAAKTFYQNYRSYLNNEDISAARRSNLRRMTHLLRREAGLKEPKVENTKGEGEKIAVEAVTIKPEAQEEEVEKIENAYPQQAEFERKVTEHYEEIGEGAVKESMEKVIENVQNYGSFDDETAKYLNELLETGAAAMADKARAQRVRNYRNVLEEDLSYGLLIKPAKKTGWREKINPRKWPRKLAKMIFKGVMKVVHRSYNVAQVRAGFEAKKLGESKEEPGEKSIGSELKQGFVAFKSVFSRTDVALMMKTRGDVVSILRREAEAVEGERRIKLVVLADELAAINEGEKQRMAPREKKPARKEVEAESVVAAMSESDQQAPEAEQGAGEPTAEDKETKAA